MDRSATSGTPREPLALSLSLRCKLRLRPEGGTRTILAGLEFAVATGSVTAIMGPSGCGKTTLLGILAGLDTDFVGERRIAPCADGRAARIGLVFQEPRLLPWRRLRDNLRLVLPEGTDPAVVDRLLAEVGLTDAAELWPRQLSLGMARRGALARALAIDPDLLLLDEPFVSLDTATAAGMHALLRRLLARRAGLTVLFATHDPAEAALLADRVLLLGGSPTGLRADIALLAPREARDPLAAEAVLRAALEEAGPSLPSPPASAR